MGDRDSAISYNFTAFARQFHVLEDIDSHLLGQEQFLVPAIFVVRWRLTGCREASLQIAIYFSEAARQMRLWEMPLFHEPAFVECSSLVAYRFIIPI